MKFAAIVFIAVVAINLLKSLKITATVHYEETEPETHQPQPLPYPGKALIKKGWLYIDGEKRCRAPKPPIGQIENSIQILSTGEVFANGFLYDDDKNEFINYKPFE